MVSNVSLCIRFQFCLFVCNLVFILETEFRSWSTEDRYSTTELQHKENLREVLELDSCLEPISPLMSDLKKVT